MPISKIPNSITVGDVSADVSIDYSSEQRSDASRTAESNEDLHRQLLLLNTRFEEAFKTGIEENDIAHEN